MSSRPVSQHSQKSSKPSRPVSNRSAKSSRKEPPPPQEQEDVKNDIQEVEEEPREQPECVVISEFDEFKKSEDKKKISLEDLGIDSQSLTSFTLLMTITGDKKQLEKLQDEIVVFSIGRSTIAKSLTIGIALDKTLFVTFKSSKGHLETISSQTTLKSSLNVSVVYESTPSRTYDITLYINGTSEASTSLGVPLEVPQGAFYLGSDSPTSTFHGSIRQPIFVTHALNSADIATISREYKVGAGSTYSRLQEQSKLQRETMNYSKRSGTPINLVRTHKYSNEELKEPKNRMAESRAGENDMGSSRQSSASRVGLQVAQMENENISEKEKAVFRVIDDFRQFIESSSNQIFEDCRHVSLNFQWVFKACMTMSPEIDGTGPKTEQECLHKQMANGSFQEYPVYLIELSRLETIFQQLGVRIPRNVLEKLGAIAQESKRLPVHKKYGEWLFYDVFLFCLRVSTLTREENDEIDMRIHEENGDKLEDIPEPEELQKPEPKPREIKAEEVEEIAIERTVDLTYQKEYKETTPNEGQTLAKEAFEEKGAQRFKLEKITFYEEEEEATTKKLLRGAKVEYQIKDEEGQKETIKWRMMPPSQVSRKSEFKKKKFDRHNIKNIRKITLLFQKINPVEEERKEAIAKAEAQAKAEAEAAKNKKGGMMKKQAEKNIEKPPPPPPEPVDDGQEVEYKTGWLEGIKISYVKEKGGEEKEKTKVFGFENSEAQIENNVSFSSFKLECLDLLTSGGEQGISHVIFSLRKTKRAVEKERAKKVEAKRKIMQEAENEDIERQLRVREQKRAEWEEENKKISDTRKQIIVLPKEGYNKNEVKFKVFITRCDECRKHQSTTRHEETIYINHFNELGEELKSHFGSVEVIGNLEKPRSFGQFDVYLLGLGPRHTRDEKGRFYLYKNGEHKGQMPDLGCFLDTLTLLLLSYGEPAAVNEEQEAFMKVWEERNPNPYQNCHGHPCQMPERVPEERPVGPQNGDRMICQHWPCFKEFIYSEHNAPNDCIYHSGKYEFGSVHALWPESWSCCRKEWTAPGCVRGPHKGVLANEKMLYCINHGKVNPGTEMPDSFCGAPFKDSGECVYHSGFIEKGRWTCCREKPENKGCLNDSHRAVNWPEPEAKIYFVRSQIRNPGTPGDSQHLTFRQLGRTSGFFRKTEPYEEVVNPDRQEMEKRKANENEDRVCINWGCGGKIYKDVANFTKPRCVSHPGVWDFGHTGISTRKAIEDMNSSEKSSILWKPHWTCCRNENFAAKGCKTVYHSGPLKAEYQPRKFEWPDPNSQVYFAKVVRPGWKDTVEKVHTFDEETVREKIKKKSSPGMLPTVCDELRLHLLVISENLAHHFRFLDVVNQRAQNYLQNGSGNIDEDKFVAWWFADMKTLMNIQNGIWPEKPKEGQKP